MVPDREGPPTEDHDNDIESIDRIREISVNELMQNADGARDIRNWPEAELFYKKVLEHNRALSAVWVQLGHTLKEQGSISEALGSYQKALENDANNSDTHLQIGHAFKLLGNLHEAQLSYLTSFRVDGNDNARSELIGTGATHLLTIADLYDVDDWAPQSYFNRVVFEADFSKWPNGLVVPIQSDLVEYSPNCFVKLNTQNGAQVTVRAFQAPGLGFQETQYATLINIKQSVTSDVKVIFRLPDNLIEEENIYLSLMVSSVPAGIVSDHEVGEVFFGRINSNGNIEKLYSVRKRVKIQYRFSLQNIAIPKSKIDLNHDRGDLCLVLQFNRSGSSAINLSQFQVNQGSQKRPLLQRASKIRPFNLRAFLLILKAIIIILYLETIQYSNQTNPMAVD